MRRPRDLPTAELRRQLEAYHADPQAGDEASSILHELQVHEIELEIQNRELREAQHQLEESRDRYADLFDFAPIGYVSITPEGIMREVNLSAAAMLGVERLRLLGLSLIQFVAPPARRSYLDHLLMCRLEGRAMTEVVLQGGTGELPVQIVSVERKDAASATFSAWR